MKNNLNVNKIEFNRSHMIYKINCAGKDCDFSNTFFMGYV